jgi:predicted dehydrogenase
LKLSTLNICAAALVLAACQKPADQTTKPVKLLTVDPGHFHAALIQKTSYPEIDSVVHVYAPAGPDLDLHLGRINSYNTRTDAPTNWAVQTHTGSDFFEQMIASKPGNVVVLSGNNQRKTEYIVKSLEAGLNVFADKPMVINTQGFESLKKAFDLAAEKKLLLYDIMTERFEISTVLQRELSMLPEVFGTLEKGTAEQPAITKESVHHFYKFVSGSVLTRPAWFMDASQQGDGIVDVTTHLVDLVQWEAFPEQTIDYNKDIVITSAKRWPTAMTLSQFKAITKLDGFPDYLSANIVNDTVLNADSNGEIIYQLKGVFAKASVIWNYKAPEGTGDTHYSIMRGTKLRFT